MDTSLPSGSAHGQCNRYNCDWCYVVNKPAASRSFLDLFLGLSYFSMIYSLAVHLKYVIAVVNPFHPDIFSQTH